MVISFVFHVLWKSACCSDFVVAFLLFSCATLASELEDKLYMMIKQVFCSEIKPVGLHI